MGLEDALRLIADTLHPSLRSQVLSHLPAVAEDPAVKQARIDKAQADLDAAKADAAPAPDAAAVPADQ
jgi:hypothetical protein